MLRRLIPLLLASLLLLLPTTGLYAAPLAQTQDVTTYEGVVNSTANLRSGPGTQYEIVGQAQAGQTLIVVACNQDCSWLQLDNGNWIAAFLVNLVARTNPSTDTPATDTPTGRSNIIDPDNLELNEPSQAALDIVVQILAYAGLPQSFDVYSANIYNAAALMVRGRRVILYDPQLIADIENVTNHDWPAVSILAHEIGHHLAGHTLGEEYNRAYELEADYFSGFILQKMGATLEEAQAVMNLLRDHPNMTDHPPQAERLTAIANGWQEAARQVDLAWEPQFSSFADEVIGTGETSDASADEIGIFSVLQQAQVLWAGESSVYVARDWSSGLRALVR